VARPRGKLWGREEASRVVSQNILHVQNFPKEPRNIRSLCNTAHIRPSGQFRNRPAIIASKTTLLNPAPTGSSRPNTESVLSWTGTFSKSLEDKHWLLIPCRRFGSLSSSQLARNVASMPTLRITFPARTRAQTAHEAAWPP
jgi:hypothetical protein